MPAAVEFFLVSLAIYLWESGLWLPRRTVSLRKLPSVGRWKPLLPGQWISTRELGLVAMTPLIPDTGLAPCQSPPLLVTDDGKILIETADSNLTDTEVQAWDDIKVESGRLSIHGISSRISSPRMVDLFRSAKKRGFTPAVGVHDAWKKAMSPHRAQMEWRRWKLVSFPLAPLCFTLTAGFFIGIPFVFLKAGVLPTFGLALFLWLVMLMIASRLWWLGKRVYPSAKNALLGDAALSCIVPFHAMRALELASVHAMATTHPAALILSTGDTNNKWLAKFSRELIYPRSGVSFDQERSNLLRPFLEQALALQGQQLVNYDHIPAKDDPDADFYCPRCHALFAQHLNHCSDCLGVTLKPFI